MATIQDGVEATVMAIRENLMDYFKGNTERFSVSNLSLERVRSSYNHHFERDHAEMINECVLKLDSIPILNVKHEPETLTFYATIDRSRSFRAVKEGVERFMQKFLPGIAIDHNPEKVTTGWQGDRKRVIANATRDIKLDAKDQSMIKALSENSGYSRMPDGYVFQDPPRTYVVRDGQWTRGEDMQVATSPFGIDTTSSVGNIWRV